MGELGGAAGSCPGGTDSHLGCAQVIAQIWTLLDGECQPGEREILQRHLDLCPECFRHFGLEERIKELIGSKCGGDKAPEGLRARLRLEIRSTTVIREYRPEEDLEEDDAR